MKLTKFLLSVLLILLVLLTTAPVAHADVRVAGVGVGTTLEYRHNSFGTMSTVDITVLQILNLSTVVYRWTERFDSGGVSNITIFTNVNGQALSSFTNGTQTPGAIGRVDMFIAQGLVGGNPEYLGSSDLVTNSIFGKILLGQWRATSYVNLVIRGWTYYKEWDKNSGALTQLTITFYGSGEQLQLTKTNLWNYDPVWGFVGNVQSAVGQAWSIARPWVTLGFGLYILSFIALRITDSMRMRKKRSLKGNSVPAWVKQAVYIALIFIGMFILIIYIIIPLIFSLIYG